MRKLYVVATRTGQPAPDDWVDGLRRIAGVQVQTGTPSQALIAADGPAIARVRSEFSRDFLIEEEVRRTPGSLA